MSLAAFVDWDGTDISDWDEYIDPVVLVRHTDGSLAPAPSYFPETKIREEQRKKRLAQQKEQRMREVRVFKEQVRAATEKRVRQTLWIILSIVIFSGMFTFVLYRQSTITVKNFQNSERQRVIRELQQETSQIKASVLNRIDETQMRWVAMEELGMQDPSAKQVVNVQMPEGDKLVNGDLVFGHALNSGNIEAAKEILAAYYQSMS